MSAQILEAMLPMHPPKPTVQVGIGYAVYQRPESPTGFEVMPTDTALQTWEQRARRSGRGRLVATAGAEVGFGTTIAISTAAIALHLSPLLPAALVGDVLALTALSYSLMRGARRRGNEAVHMVEATRQEFARQGIQPTQQAIATRR